jgi:hypothetical protein
MKKWLLTGAIGGLLLSWQLWLPSTALAQPRTFTELWNNFAFYDTNLERRGFSSSLARFEGKFGISLFNSPLQIYGAYYGISSQTADYFNNSLFAGGGVRFKPFGSFKGTGWQNEWLSGVKLFAESLSSSYFKGSASAEAANLAKTDRRYGFDLWHEWNLDKANENLPWGELWANLSYRETNFGWEPFNEYVFYFQPKIGKHLGRGVEPYLRAGVVVSGKQGPSYYFLNVADYGVGIRFEPWRKSEDPNELLRKFKMFVEVLGSAYLKDKPAGAVNSDVRLGIDFSYGR